MLGRLLRTMRKPRRPQNAAPSPIVIDLRGESRDPYYLARLIVEALIRAERAWEWGSLDNILCDVKCFQHHIEMGDYKLFWTFGPRFGHTWILSQFPYEDVQYLIHIRGYREVEGKIVIQRIAWPEGGRN